MVRILELNLHLVETGEQNMIIIIIIIEIEAQGFRWFSQLCLIKVYLNTSFSNISYKVQVVNNKLVVVNQFTLSSNQVANQLI